MQEDPVNRIGSAYKNCFHNYIDLSQMANFPCLLKLLTEFLFNPQKNYFFYQLLIV